MSAIWGIIDLNGQAISQAACRTMEQIYETKKIEKIQTICKDNFYLACALQYPNPEAQKEDYPYVTNGSYLVADAILDNRKELQESFQMTHSLSREGVDGSILFDCVQQDMNKALDEMLGAYVFAHYSDSKGTLTLANDVTGTRSVYYMVENNRFYFSTLLKPLLQFIKDRQPCKEWLITFWAQSDLRIVSDSRLTPYENILRLSPGEILTFNKQGLNRRDYWNPLANKKKLQLSKEECKKLVQTVYRNCVESMIRDEDTALLLSGGLDSNSVAAFAAPKLKSIGKNLYTFTSVPDANTPTPITTTYYVDDERSYVELLQKKHSNLIPEWIGCNQYSILEQCDYLLDLYETPFKSIPNLPWIADANKRAAEKGCGVLLCGQYGNITISYGNYENLLSTLIKQGHFKELHKQICKLSPLIRKSKKWIYRSLLPLIFNSGTTNIAYKELNQDILRSHKKHIKLIKGKRKLLSEAHDCMQKYMYDKIALRQVGEAETKMSLEFGIITRDPTRDKRLIELVLSLPIEHFVSNGESRKLVRVYLSDFIPPEITQDISHRGSQGVGTYQSIHTQWNEISTELIKEFSTTHGKPYMNLPFLIDSIKHNDYSEDDVNTVRLIYGFLMSKFIGKNFDLL